MFRVVFALQLVGVCLGSQFAGLNLNFGGMQGSSRTQGEGKLLPLMGTSWRTKHPKHHPSRKPAHKPVRSIRRNPTLRPTKGVKPVKSSPPTAQPTESPTDAPLQIMDLPVTFGDEDNENGFELTAGTLLGTVSLPPQYVVSFEIKPTSESSQWGEVLHL